MEDDMTTKKHNDLSGEEMMILFNKYYYLDDLVKTFIMNIDAMRNKQSKWYRFKSVLFGESGAIHKRHYHFS